MTHTVSIHDTSFDLLLSLSRSSHKIELFFRFSSLFHYCKCAIINNNNNNNNNNMVVSSTTGDLCGALSKLTNLLMRISLLGYSALAVFGFLETRQLLQKDGVDAYRYKDDTLFVPLVLCVPESIDIDGEILIMDTSATSMDQCRQLDYLINACAISLLFSIAASILFLLVDCMARYQRGPFNMSSAAGMGLFLVFILLQAGISTGALVEQTYFWVQHFQGIVDETNNNGNLGFDKVQSYANQTVLTSTALCAFGCSLVIFVHAMVYQCCSCQTPADVKDERQEQATADEAMKRQSMQIEEATQSSNSKPFEMSSERSAGSPLWASTGV
jgi:hypothetical protein